MAETGGRGSFLASICVFIYVVNLFLPGSVSSFPALISPVFSSSYMAPLASSSNMRCVLLDRMIDRVGLLGKINY